METMTISDLGRRYRVDASSLLLGNILNQICQGQPLTPAFLNYLQSKKLFDLHKHATGELTFEGYLSALDAAEAERVAQVIAAREAEAARLAQVAEMRRIREEAAEAARIARERDPACIAMKQREATCESPSKIAWFGSPTRITHMSGLSRGNIRRKNPFCISDVSCISSISTHGNL
jgi:hypothetical protein